MCYHAAESGSTVRILCNDLKRHTDATRAELDSAIGRVLARGWYVLGPEVEAFEREFAGFCQGEACVGVANGTDALELALRALGVGAQDQVATVANAGFYSTTAILAVGAEPLYVEIEPARMTMDPEALAAALTPRTKAIIVTHLYGQMADLPALVEVARRAGVPLVEDCAQAHGAVLDGRPAGSWDAAGCFSFYPTKNLGALGDGGAVVTSDPEVARRLRLLRQYGWSSRFQSALPGGRNSRLDELQAAVLTARLPHLAKWNQRRRAIARAYSDAFRQAPLVLPASLGDDYVAHLYVVRTRRRDELKQALTQMEIGAEVHYPIPDHRQESLRSPLPLLRDLPVTEQSCREVLTLPCFPELSDREVHLVIEAVLRFFEDPFHAP
jgi:dTDP-4-amino-4,6-dideoxygalactose transaminase